jgi:hypothetical protein
MYRATWAAVLAIVLCGCLSRGMAADKKDKETANERTVTGTVTDGHDNPVNGAVVYIENKKSMQIRSFITKEAGGYYFHSLSPDVDYQLHAEYNGASSPNKTLSSFDSRKQAVLNLKLK